MDSNTLIAIILPVVAVVLLIIAAVFVYGSGKNKLLPNAGPLKYRGSEAYHSMASDHSMASESYQVADNSQFL